ncbi:MAG: carbon-nitrogen hydrolase family protein [Candidatus Lokiarchaeota archaeon]|nr:carbon-nitrogen hydrolase family protein [Candidatus Lokiarchaeota archaeon]
MERYTSLLERAKREEKDHNWKKVAKLYEQISKIFVEKKELVKAAKTFKKLGYAYNRAAEIIKTQEDHYKLNILAINAYNEAIKTYEHIKNKSQQLECLAEVNFIKGILSDSIEQAKQEFSESHKLFIEAGELYSEKNKQKSIARVLGRAAMALFFLLTYYSESEDIEQLYEKGRELAIKAWELSKEVRNIQSLAEALFAERMLFFMIFSIIPFKWDESWKSYMKKGLLRCNESLKLAEDCEDPYILGSIYSMVGSWFCAYGFQFIEEESKQKDYTEKGLELMEKGLSFSRKSKNNSLIIISLWWLNWLAISIRKFEFVQSRISQDLQEIEELGKIFSNSHIIWYYYSNLLPAFYYATVSYRSFFTVEQRKSYAKKGIEYAKRALTSLAYRPYFGWPYQMSTWSYSQLVNLDTSNEKRKEYSHNMLQYALKAKEIGEKYEGGFVRAIGYSSLFRAYKTLSDNATTKQDKVEMLLAAIDASEKNMKHAVWSRTGIIAAQMRLGFLYEELGIITGKIDDLMKAKETYLNVISNCDERGYHSYAAAAHEYIAHVEDRIGNYLRSSEHYKKAQDAYKQSLRYIEYRLLKNKIEEKINYTLAWSSIENAKAYHKKENHIKAKESYEKAFEILKDLPNFKYESIYYSAWAKQEEAEQFSKLEMHKEATEKYKTTEKAFYDSIKTMDEISGQTKDKFIIERIKKLEKVAQLRIRYCSARLNVEKARILGKQGEYYAAAELFASAASEFREVCNLFKVERERGELEAVYYLCRAWESMELAEKYGDPERFAEAANLFSKASKLFSDSKLKLLASANSAFCEALELGCEFDETYESEVKAQLYPKIKSMLRTAASSYEKGGFKNGADWALATSTYFDAVWHLIRADEELEISYKKNLLDIGANYLKSAAELFSKSGHKDKEREILTRLERLEHEEKILVSALNTIKKPSISSSTMGIIAPACSLETSQSPRLGEVSQFNEEERRVMGERLAKKKYEIIYRDLFKEYPRAQKREFRVGIAQIGISETGDILSEFYKMETSGLLSLREDKLENVRMKVKNMIENAHKERVNVLLFPEMAIDLNYGELLEDISDLAKLYEMYIIPGSFHDRGTKKNIARVFGPDGILWEQEKYIPAIIQQGERKFKEGINVGDVPHNIFVCNTEFGRIAIAICRDFLDMDLRVELKNFEPPVDIIINPAFTPVTADFKAIHFDARRSIYAYCFFANIAEFGDSLIYTPEKDRTERTIPSKEEGLMYKDIDLFKLRSERRRWEKEQKKEVQFIQSTRS